MCELSSGNVEHVGYFLLLLDIAESLAVVRVFVDCESIEDYQQHGRENAHYQDTQTDGLAGVAVSRCYVVCAPGKISSDIAGGLIDLILDLIVKVYGSNERIFTGALLFEVLFVLLPFLFFLLALALGVLLFCRLLFSLLFGFFLFSWLFYLFSFRNFFRLYFGFRFSLFIGRYFISNFLCCLFSMFFDFGFCRFFSFSRLFSFRLCLSLGFRIFFHRNIARREAVLLQISCICEGRCPHEVFFFFGLVFRRVFCCFVYQFFYICHSDLLLSPIHLNASSALSFAQLHTIPSLV